MSSYRQIFKSTAIVGGAQVILILLGLVRSKAAALWLGPAGVGDMRLLSTGVSLVGVITGLGIGASGVRRIAETYAAGDQEQFGRTVRTLRVSAFFTSLLGVLVTACFCWLLSDVSYNSRDHSIAFALVGISLLFHGVSAGQASGRSVYSAHLAEAADDADDFGEADRLVERRRGFLGASCSVCDLG